MTEHTISFYTYISKTRSKNVDEFLETFYDKLDMIPAQSVVSSKYLIGVLGLTNRRKFTVFRNVYCDYFKHTILNEQSHCR
jgi:hypothetical protein